MTSLLIFGIPRYLSFGRSRVNGSGLLFHWFRVVVVFGSLISFFITISSGYIYVLPSLTQPSHDFTYSFGLGECNVFDGSWVMDNSYPLYNASECPFVEQGFSCLENGRNNYNYLKWRWKPRHCEVPRFNVHDILERFKNKRIVFVGDSMSRTQWESLICLLMTGVDNKKSVYEVNRSKITKQIRFLGVRFDSFNFTIEFFRSVFLVKHSWMPRHAPKRVRSMLRLDKLDDISNEWVKSDVLIFNTGHWWVPGKLFDLGCYFQVGNSLKLGMSIPSAFRIALETWAEWVQNLIDANRTRVFFRTFEPSHWSDQFQRACNVSRQPTSNTQGRDTSIFSDIAVDVIKNMTVPVTVLHITEMSAFRSDAHVGNSDCSHWCLPGLPDMWNEILLSFL